MNQEIDFTDFDFISDPVEEQGAKLVPPTPAPLDRLANKYTPRKFAQDVLDTLVKLGGADWIFTQAIADPKSYLDLLKRILPRNLQLDGIEGLTVTLIDRFGNSMEIDASGGASRPASPAAGGNGSGQPIQIATSGTPNDDPEIIVLDKAEDMK